MKLYTAFISDLDAKLHCTHKYLGHQNAENFEKICYLIRDYLARESRLS
jgi:hypothetical protein